MAMGTVLARKALNPKYMSGDGVARWLSDTADVTTALAATDVIKYRVPAGSTVHFLEIRPDDLDSSTGITFKTGYAAVDSASTLVADDDYFATSKTNMQTGNALSCNFVPIKFEEDIWITITIIATATTPVAGTVTAVAGINCDGVK